MTPARVPISSISTRLRPRQTYTTFASLRCLTSLTRTTLPSFYPISRTRPLLSRRFLATENDSATTLLAQDVTKEPLAEQPTNIAPEDEVYNGPLTSTYRRLKIFSLSTLSLSFALTPFIFVIETTSSVPVVARFALAGMAMAASGVSTALVAWVGRPYVSTLRWLKPEGEQVAGGGDAVEMTTFTLALHNRITTVYDTAFLVPTSRPFATWELAEAFKLPEAEVESARAQGLIPREETIAETRNRAGELLGSWVVSWDEHGVGTCRQIGKVPRYFNVHQELLSRPIR